MSSKNNKGKSENEIVDKLESLGSKKTSEQKVRKSFLKYFKRNQSKISFGEKIETLYDWVTSGKLSKPDKAIVIGALLYFINPLDALPDITPFIGFSDDLGIIYLVFNYLQNRSLEEKDKSREEKKKS